MHAEITIKPPETFSYHFFVLFCYEITNVADGSLFLMHGFFWC